MALLESLIYRKDLLSRINVVQGQEMGNPYRLEFATKPNYKIEKVIIDGIRENGDIVTIVKGSATLSNGETTFAGALSPLKATIKIEIVIVNSDGTPIDPEIPDVPPSNFVTVSKELKGCSTLLPDDDVNKYESLEFVIKCDEGYKFSSPITVSGGSETGELYKYVPSLDSPTRDDFNEDFTELYVSIMVYDNVVIKATALSLNLHMNTTLELSNCTVELFPNVFSYGDIVSFSVIANDGYYFNEEIKVGGFDSNDTTFRVYLFNSPDPNHVPYQDNETTLNDRITVNSKLTIIANAILDDRNLPEEPVEPEEPIENNVFTDIVELDYLGFTKVKDVWFSDVMENATDYRQFVYDLYLLPFKVDYLREVTKRNLKLSSLDTNVKVFYLDDNILKIDLGVIQVPFKYDNVFDYVDTVCWLNVPYFKKVELDVAQVIGYEVGVSMVVDLYTRQCTLNVSSSFSGGTIASVNNKIGDTIPYIQKYNESVKGDIIDKVYNEVNTPYIEVIRNIPYNVDNVFGSDVDDVGLLNSFSGYLEVENIDLNFASSEIIKDEIRNILRTGIIIK